MSRRGILGIVAGGGDFTGLVVTTIGAAPATLTIPRPRDGTTIVVEARVAARRTDVAGTGAGYRIGGAFRRAGAVTTQIGSTSVVWQAEDAGAAAWDVTFAVSGADVQVQVTGAVGMTVSWETEGNTTDT